MREQEPKPARAGLEVATEGLRATQPPLGVRQGNATSNINNKPVTINPQLHTHRGSVRLRHCLDEPVRRHASRSAKGGSRLDVPEETEWCSARLDDVRGELVHGLDEPGAPPGTQLPEEAPRLDERDLHCVPSCCRVAPAYGGIGGVAGDHERLDRTVVECVGERLALVLVVLRGRRCERQAEHRGGTAEHGELGRHGTDGHEHAEGRSRTPVHRDLEDRAGGCVGACDQSAAVVTQPERGQTEAPLERGQGGSRSTALGEQNGDLAQHEARVDGRRLVPFSHDDPFRRYREAA